MTRAWGGLIRTLLVALAVAGAVTAAAPTAAVAQSVPVHEEDEQRHRMLTLRLNEWYTMTREWWNTSVRKAKDFAAYTATLIGIREKAERDALGENTPLGGEMRDYRDYGCTTAVDSAGVQQDCIDDRTLEARIARTVDPGLAEDRRFRVAADSSDMFASRESIDSTLSAIVGLDFRHGIDSAIAAFAGTPDARLVATYAATLQRGRDAVAMDSLATTLHTLLDQVSEQELAGGAAVSSGRAQQISAALSFIAATVEHQVARERLSALTQRLLVTADNLHMQRIDRQASHVTALSALSVTTPPDSSSTP